MKKFWFFILIAVIALGFTAVASANDVCPRDTDGWSSEQQAPLVDKSGEGAVEYCVKGGSVAATGAGCNAYLEFGSFEYVSSVVDAEGACGLSHWTYRVEEQHDYWLDAWVEVDCEGACLYIEVYDGDDSIMGPFKVGCDEWTDPYTLESAGPWTNIVYNAGGDIGTLRAADVPAVREPRECLEEPPDPEVRFDTGCGEDCIPRFFVGFTPGLRGDKLVITGPTGAVYEYTEPTEKREMARPGTHTWMVYRDDEPIMRGSFDVDPCDCPVDPNVEFQQGCVDGVPVIGINFVGEEGHTLSITGNGRDLSYVPGVYREKMRPFEGYLWVIYYNEEPVKRGTLDVEVCPADTPTPTPPPKKTPPSGGADEAAPIVVGIMLTGGVLALLFGIREYNIARKKEG